MAIEDDKRAAAEAAAQEVADGMVLGLGTGTTSAYLVPALARRQADVRCVATSPAMEDAARRAGLRVVAFDNLDHVDIAIDGADQVAPDLWLIKGGGGAQTREKLVASSADRFVVIVSSNKLVDRLEPPVPLELIAFGVESTLHSLGRLGPVHLRANTPRSPDGGVIADFFGAVDDPAGLAARLNAVDGVVSHGLFPPALVSDVVVGRAGAAAYLRDGPC